MSEAQRALDKLEKAVERAEENAGNPLYHELYEIALAEVHALDDAHERGFREPVGLGHVIVDDADLDYDLTQPLDTSISD
jgi:hypothetical protein